MERVVPEGVANVVRSEDRQMFCMVRGRWLKLRCEQQLGLALIMKRHAKGRGDNTGLRRQTSRHQAKTRQRQGLP